MADAGHDVLLRLVTLIQAEPHMQASEYGDRLAIDGKRMARLLVVMERIGVLLAEDDDGGLLYVGGIERLRLRGGERGLENLF